MTHNYSAKDNTFMHCCLKENKNISYDFDFKITYRKFYKFSSTYIVHTAKLFRIETKRRKIIEA